MDAHYDVEAWAGETRTGRRIFNHGFRMQGSEAPGWTLIKSVPMHSDEEVRETAYLWRSDEAPDRMLVRVLVAELAGWRQAQNYLRRSLDHVMRPNLPGGAGSLAAAGDVAFVAEERESDIPAAMFLARGNVAVLVDSVGSTAVDVSGFAEAADRLLADGPKTGWDRDPENRLSVRPDPGGAATSVTTVKEGEGLWLRVAASDGELRRDGDSIFYDPPKDGAGDVVLLTLRPASKAGIVSGEDEGEGNSKGETVRPGWPWWLLALLIAALLVLLAFGPDRVARSVGLG